MLFQHLADALRSFNFDIMNIVHRFVSLPSASAEGQPFTLLSGLVSADHGEHASAECVACNPVDGTALSG